MKLSDKNVEKRIKSHEKFSKKMDKVLHELIYDTSEATEIVSTGGGSRPMDYGWWRETLYVTEQGEFFIAGEGGALSKYRRAVGGGEWSPGDEIIAMTKDKVLNWCKENNIKPDVISEFIELEKA